MINSFTRICLLSFLLITSFPALTLAAPPRTAPTGTIAYVRNWEQIRLIAPDGSGERELWTQPPSESRYGGVRELAFRPDGKELAFASSHEMAHSFYESDLYGIGLDGKGLHRLTNPPSLDKLAAYPKCKVEVTVTNRSTDPLASLVVLYVVGASKPESLMVSHNAVATVMFKEVAVLPGGAVQPVMAAFGGRRWPGPPMRLVAGQTNKAVMMLSGRGFEMMGAYGPVWSRDGKQIAYRFTEGAGIWCVSGQGEPGAGIGTRLGDKALSHVAAFDLGPPDVPGGNLLYAGGVTADGERDNSVYQSDEQGRRPRRVLHYQEGMAIQQVRWLPDASGFIVLRMEPLTFAEGANLCRVDLASGRETQLTNFKDEAVRDFAVSPDGRWIVYERGQAIYNPWDTTRPALWLIRTNGRDERLLVKSGGMPAWGR